MVASGRIISLIYLIISSKATFLMAQKFFPRPLRSEIKYGSKKSKKIVEQY